MRARILASVLLSTVAFACSSSDSGSGDSTTGAGGSSTGTGGSTVGKGGSVSTGGTSSTGGSAGTGGSTAGTGGTSSKGGSSGKGGSAGSTGGKGGSAGSGTGGSTGGKGGSAGSGTGGSTGGKGGSAGSGTGGSTGGSSGSGGATAGAGGSTGGSGGATAGAGGSTGGSGGAAAGAGGTDAGGSGGSAGGSTGGAGGSTGGCTEITLSGFKAYAGNKNFSLEGAVSPNVDGTGPESFRLEVYAAPVVGSVDLAVAPQDNYATCDDCARFDTDLVMGTPTKVFFQSGGTLAITKADPGLTGAFAGSLTDVTLIEVTIDGMTFTSTPVPNGECFHIASATWDTTVPSTCTDVTAGSFAIKTPAMGSPYVQGVTSQFGGTDPDTINLEFYNAQAAGSYTLGTGADADYATCDHCVIVGQDNNGTNIAAAFFASAGTMAVTTPDTGNGKSKGTLTGVTLVEVTLDQMTGASTPIPGGACLNLATTSWDTTQLSADPAVGRASPSRPADCGRRMPRGCERYLDRVAKRGSRDASATSSSAVASSSTPWSSG
jgi:hypothetical protein